MIEIVSIVKRVAGTDVRSVKSKRIISGPPHMEEAMWYMLIGFFVMIWMWMFIWA